MESIKERILSQPLAKLYVVHGEEQYLQRQIYDTLQRRIEQDGAFEWNWINLRASKDLQSGDIIREIITTPWGNGEKVIALTDAELLPAKDLEKLAEWISNTETTNCLAMFFTKIDKRLKAIKMLLRIGVVVECNALKGETLVRWVQDYVRLKHKKIDRAVVERFLAKTGSDLNFITNELEKLLLYIGSETVIRDEDVSAITSTGPGQLHHGAIFDMVEAIAARNLSNALAILTQLLDAKEPPLRILPLIDRQLRLLLTAKTRGSMSITVAAKAMGESRDYSLKQIEKYKGNFTLDEIYAGLEQVLACDSELKFGADPTQTLEQLIINLCKK